MRYAAPLSHFRRQPKIKLIGLSDFFRFLPKNVFNILQRVKNIGVTTGMNTVEKSKLNVFNTLNFFQVITGFMVSVIALLSASKISVIGWLIACSPALVSIAVLVLNSKRKHQLALLIYFALYPFFICLSYFNGVSLGGTSFILYGILSVFFIQDIGYMIFSISFSMVCYFVLSVIAKTYPYQLENINFIAYLINQALAIIYIFYGLYLIKTENANYNTALHQTNVEMEKQASQLKQQADELDQLNSLKNKLFSVISHDLKAPMYALRNLFENMDSQDMPADEIKSWVPEIKKDMNYTVSLMENLLLWARSQMQSHTVKAQLINVTDIIDGVIHLLHLQADAKHIKLEKRSEGAVYVWADNDMINLVVRNLVSNAIKFTPSGGQVIIGANEHPTYAEVYVQDSGLGMSPKELKKVNSQEFFTTNGTAQEQGTGIGLMLCREFLAKNDGYLRIESEQGKGSTFSFTLPLGD